jgi:hypothetical protein
LPRIAISRRANGPLPRGGVRYSSEAELDSLARRRRRLRQMRGQRSEARGQRPEARVGARYWGGLVVKRSFPSSSAQIGLVTVGWSLDSKWQWQWQIAAQYPVSRTYLRLLRAGLHDAAAGLLEVEGRSPDRVGLLQLPLDLRGCHGAVGAWEVPIDAVAGLLQNLAAHKIATSPASPLHRVQAVGGCQQQSRLQREPVIRMVSRQQTYQRQRAWCQKSYRRAYR